MPIAIKKAISRYSTRCHIYFDKKQSWKSLDERFPAGVPQRRDRGAAKYGITAFLLMFNYIKCRQIVILTSKGWKTMACTLDIFSTLYLSVIETKELWSCKHQSCLFPHHIWWRKLSLLGIRTCYEEWPKLDVKWFDRQRMIRMINMPKNWLTSSKMYIFFTDLDKHSLIMIIGFRLASIFANVQAVF